MTMTSNRSYLTRAIRDWINDNGLTPHVVVDASAEGVEVPVEHIDDAQQIVLDVSENMVRNFELNMTHLSFDAAFPGVIYHIHVPVSAIMAIYCKDNGQGIVFEEEEEWDMPAPTTPHFQALEGGATDDPSDTPPKPKGKHHLKIIK